MPDAWLASYPGVREHEPLARHSWYRIGGRARYFLELSDDAALPKLLARLENERQPYLIVGAATNTLFAPAELPGLTIKLATRRLSMAGNVVSVSAGYLMPKLAAETAKAGRAQLQIQERPGDVEWTQDQKHERVRGLFVWETRRERERGDA